MIREQGMNKNKRKIERKQQQQKNVRKEKAVVRFKVN